MHLDTLHYVYRFRILFPNVKFKYTKTIIQKGTSVFALTFQKAEAIQCIVYIRRVIRPEQIYLNKILCATLQNLLV